LNFDHPHLVRWRHPERSRFSGGARDLARGVSVVRARSLGPLVKARAFGMTPHRRIGFKLSHYLLDQQQSFRIDDSFLVRLIKVSNVELFH
jgi:hypothetical protein